MSRSAWSGRATLVGYVQVGSKFNQIDLDRGNSLVIMETIFE